MSQLPTRRAVCRGLCAVVAGGFFVGNARLSHAEKLSLAGQSQVFELPPDEGALKPPVVSAVRFDPIGRQVAAVGDDHYVRLYDVAAGKQTAKLTGHTDWVRAVDYSFDGGKLYSAGNDRRLLAWDAKDPTAAPTLVATQPQAIAGVRCGRKSALVATVGFEQTVRLYDVSQSPPQVREFEGPGGALNGIDFSPDDAWLAAAGLKGKVRIWDTASGRLLLEFAPHTRRVQALAFSPDGKYLATGGDDRRVHIQPVSSQTQGWMLPETGGKILAVVFLGDLQLAAAGSDNRIHVWDILQKKSLGVLEGHTGSIRTLDFRGRRLISAGFDTQLRVWSLGEKVAEAETVPIR